LGVWLDHPRNNAQEDVISSEQSTCQVRVMATNEELMIARHTRAAIFSGTSPTRSK
jgi:acetate kinase